MSVSFPCFDEATRSLFSWLAPASALELAMTAGPGRYGRLLAEAAPDSSCDVLNARQPGVDWPLLSGSFDLVIAADCLNTIPKSQGMDLLNALVYRTAWLLVVVPEFLPAELGTESGERAPQSVWSERDFHWHDRWAWDNCRTVNWILLRGHRPAAQSLEAMVQRFNEARLPVLDFDAQTVVRPAWLRMVEHPREVNYRGY
jgi:hypothetical protein